MTSFSKSKSIRDIENKYGINLTSCTRVQLNKLISQKVITKLSDLMINTKQFDIDQMSDIERANLKYLVMSTDELLNLLSKKSKSIYYKPCEYRLRQLMSYNDFYQTCAYKLLLNDGILRFNANYKLDPAIHCWLLRTAMWKSYKRVTCPDELYILDKPCSDDTVTTIGDLILKEDNDLDFESSIDSSKRIDWILSQMNKVSNNRIVLKINNTVVPLSEYNLAKLFIVHRLNKKELSKMVYNVTSNRLVSNQIFNKFYKQTLMHIAELLNKEAIECGERFSINESEL